MALAPTTQPRPAPTSAPRPAAVPAPKPSKLAGITAGALPNPRRFFFYGTRGIGKSSLAADAPNPIVFDMANATEHLHVARYPFGSEPTYPDVLAAIDDLSDSPHEYKTLVIEDTGDLESRIWKHLVATAPLPKSGDKIETIEDFGFGKGYTIAEGEWRVLFAKLDALRLKKKMHIIFLGHSAVATFKNPHGENFDWWSPQIHKLAFGVLGANCDVVGFVTFDDATKQVRQGPSKKTIGATGTRVIQLEHSASWFAKSRLPLPAMLDLEDDHPFRPFAQAMAQLEGMSPEMLRQKISAELDRVGSPFIDSKGSEATRERVIAAVKAAGPDNIDTLTRFLTLLRQASPITATTETTP